MVREVITPEIHALIDPIVASLKRHQVVEDKEVALLIAQLLMKIISVSRWSNSQELIDIIRQVGLIIHKSYPRKIIPGNIIRRVLFIIREETLDEEISNDGSNNIPMMSSMFSLLYTNKKKEYNNNTAKPKAKTSDMRSIIIQGIRELIDEISNVDEGIENMIGDLIHDNEVLLTPTPNSESVLHFLIKAKAKRNFTVIVTENYPNDIEESHRFVKKLAEHKIETILIPDSTSYAVMSRVGKVIISTNAVFANGGCLSNSGVSQVVECAKEHRTPVFAIAGLYKLSPLYPFTKDDLIEVGNSGKVLSYDDYNLIENVQVVTNPLEDYIPPELIDIFITNIGGFAPTFIYRIVLDNYKVEDNKLD